METEPAPAKLNLCLHVTGQRADGYHLLDSLVAFASVGDTITARPADHLSLAITGEQAARLPVTEDNLVLRAARLLAPDRAAALVLDKRLPIASGIGGGSADAAATLRALARLWHLPLPDPAAILRLGADVPVCMGTAPVRMQGVGEVLTRLPPLPETHVVLANPGVALGTPSVFKALTRKDNPPISGMPRFASARDLASWLIDQRNDLEPAARRLAPKIGTVLKALHACENALLARMSGSGATCFALFPDAASARLAAERLAHAHPDWWVEAGRLLGADHGTAPLS